MKLSFLLTAVAILVVLFQAPQTDAVVVSKQQEKASLAASSSQDQSSISSNPFCTQASFRVSELHPVKFDTLSSAESAGFWSQSIHTSTELQSDLLQCSRHVSYLWRLQYGGSMEGAVSTIVGFAVQAQNEKHQHEYSFGEIQYIDFNYGDPENQPAIQPLLVTAAEEIEKPSANLPSGRYYKLTVTGLTENSRAVVRIDIPFDCHETEETVRTQEEREDQLKIHAFTLDKMAKVDCTEEIALDVEGFPQHDFGPMRIFVDGATAQKDKVSMDQTSHAIALSINNAPSGIEISTTFRQRARATLKLVIKLAPAGSTCDQAVAYTDYYFSPGACNDVLFCFELSNTGPGILEDLKVVADFDGTGVADVTNFSPEPIGNGCPSTPNCNYYSYQTRVYSIGGSSDFVYTAQGHSNFVGVGPILSNIVTIHFKVDNGDPNSCDCIVDDVVDARAFTCDFTTGTTTEIECAMTIKPQTNYRCAVTGETPTAVCSIQSKAICQYNPSYPVQRDKYFCDLIVQDSFVVTPYGSACNPE